MGQLARGKYLRQLNYGLSLDRPTSVVPQTNTAPIFTITGGRVIVTGLVGTVTAAGSATATNLKLRSTPASGGAIADLSANGAVTSASVGSVITITGAPGDALALSTANGQILDNNGIVLPAGTISQTTDASNATLAIQWTILWLPLDDAGTIAAA